MIAGMGRERDQRWGGRWRKARRILLWGSGDTLQSHVVYTFFLENYINHVSLPPSQRIISIRGCLVPFKDPYPLVDQTTRYNKAHLSRNLGNKQQRIFLTVVIATFPTLLQQFLKPHHVPSPLTSLKTMEEERGKVTKVPEGRCKIKTFKTQNTKT